MTKKNKGVIFKTVEEYRAFYTSEAKKQQLRESKYYRIGADLAKMACQKAVNTLSQEQVPPVANFGCFRNH